MSTLENYLMKSLVPTIVRNNMAQGTVVIGVTGNVASGKTTLAKQVQQECERQFPGMSTFLVSTDNFLMTNCQLRARQLMERKGFPETYDHRLMKHFVRAINHDQEVSLPEYDHMIDNINRRRSVLISHPDIIILEGLMTLQPEFSELLDESIFLDVDVASNFDWFMKRCFDLNLPALYKLAEPDFIALAKHNWEAINLRNYLDNVLPLKDQATVQVQLGAQHQIETIALRLELKIAANLMKQVQK